MVGSVREPCRTWWPPEGWTDPGGRISPSVRFWFGEGSIVGVRAARASARSRASWNPIGSVNGTYRCQPPLGLSSVMTRPPAAWTRSRTAAASRRTASGPPPESRSTTRTRVSPPPE